MAEVQPGRTGASRDMRSQSRALGAGIVEQISGSCISSVLNKLHGSIAGIPDIAGMAAALLSRVDDQRLVCWWCPGWTTKDLSVGGSEGGPGWDEGDEEQGAAENTGQNAQQEQSAIPRPDGILRLRQNEQQSTHGTRA